MHRSSTFYKKKMSKTVLNEDRVWCERTTGDGLFHWSKHYYGLWTVRLIGNTCLYIHFCNTVIMYLAARFAAVSKWNVQRVALKHTFNTVTVTRFYYVGTCTYCSVFIMLLEVRFAAIHNSNIQWVSLKIKLYEVGSIPYTKSKPKPTRKC